MSLLERVFLSPHSVPFALDGKVPALPMVMIPIPEELQHLIEKRERTRDRRAQDRRQEDVGPSGGVLPAEANDDVPETDRRSSQRRCGKDRRGALG